MKINVKIQSKPRPRAVVKGRFAQIYTPNEAKVYEQYIANEYKKYGGVNYGKEPIILQLIFEFKMPARFPKWKKGNYMLIPCDIHKDIDNIAKSVLDALNGVAYEDDRQVIALNVYKRYTIEEEGIDITINRAPFPKEERVKELWQAKN